ncbi:hypothetical protein NVP1015O_18 [Vibrio phage 1.015.O._10N.222.51.E5]|nr:hypothetical protein NVP1015O_18 [Vibrio phage 1.015.O._10N.222.51.E5]
MTFLTDRPYLQLPAEFPNLPRLDPTCGYRPDAPMTCRIVESEENFFETTVKDSQNISVLFTVNSNFKHYRIAENSNGVGGIELTNTEENRYAVVVTGESPICSTVIENVVILPGDRVLVWMDYFTYQGTPTIDIWVQVYSLLGGGEFNGWQPRYAVDAYRSDEFVGDFDYLFDTYYATPDVSLANISIGRHFASTNPIYWNFNFVNLDENMVLYNINKADPEDPDDLRLIVEVEGEVFNPANQYGDWRDV